MPWYFIENLTLLHWLTVAWPRLCRAQRAGHAMGRIYYVDGSRAGVAVAKRMARWQRLLFERFDFDSAHMHDEAGLLIWLRIYYRDMAVALQWVLDDPFFVEQFKSQFRRAHLLWFLRKECLPGASIIQRAGLWRAIYLVHACLWKLRTENTPGDSLVLLLNRRPWMDAFARYAAAAGPITIISSGNGFGFRSYLLRLLGREGRMLIEKIQRVATGTFSPQCRSTEPNNALPAVAVQCCGHFNFDAPERHSDFFFWQQSSLPGRNVIALFGLPQDPLDETRLRALEGHGMRALALRFSATTLAPAYVHGDTHLLRRIAGAARLLSDWFQPGESRWLRAETLRFDEEKHYWQELFARQNIKLFTTWFKYNADHCVIAEALSQVGGALAIYQRSYEGNATAQATLSTDILFTFSPYSAQVEKEAGSRIDYCVVTGYLGDHRFRLAQTAAETLRKRLHEKGASFIAAFFDEGSFDDPRWILGHERQRDHYAFLLQKVLTDADFGLILKPKSPQSLQRRLGPVAPVLEQAIATGRCCIFGEGVIQAAIPPAQAAMSADLAIHSSVASGTAGVEAALAGVPTVLMDDDNWTISPLYRLDKNRVIFDDWDALWHTWRDHRVQPHGVPGFGAWSALLDELDPFRDGRAAKRMGTYLKWLIEGFEGGLPRETVLADAAERYCRAWGTDKVTSVRPATPGACS